PAHLEIYTLSLHDALPIYMDNIKKVYLIGIGGIGMSGLARYFNHNGYRVSGYDKTQTSLTKELEKEGIDVIYQDLRSRIPSEFLSDAVETLVIYTPAVQKSADVVRSFEEGGHRLHERSEVLGYLSASK